MLTDSQDGNVAQQQVWPRSGYSLSLSLYQSIALSFTLSVCPHSVSLSLSLSIYRSIFHSLCLSSLCLSVPLSTYLFFFPWQVRTRSGCWGDFFIWFSPLLSHVLYSLSPCVHDAGCIWWVVCVYVCMARWVFIVVCACVCVCVCVCVSRSLAFHQG